MKNIKLMAKILLLIGIPVMVVYLIANIYTAKMVKQSVLQLTTEELTAKSLTASNEINSYFLKYETIVEQMAANDQIQQYFAKSYEDKSRNSKDGYGGIKDTIENIANTDPDNLSSVWYCDCESSLMISKSRDKPYSQTLSEKPWYQPAVGQKGVVLTEPYTDTVTDKMVLSIVSPTYKTGTDTLVGFAGIDITLDRLYDTIQSYQLGTSGFYMLASAEGQLIYYPDESLKDKNVTEAGMSDNISKAIQSGKSGFLTYTAMGTLNYGYVSAVGDTGWTVATGLPETEFYSPYYSMLYSAVTIFLIALAVIFVLIILISRSIVHPLKKLKTTAGKIADGKLDVQIDVSSSDEIGQVANAFSRTVDRLKQYIKYINEITAVLNRIASGDLTFELHCDYTGEFEKIKNSLENIKFSLTNTFSEIDKSADQVASGSKLATNASQNLAQGSTEQASSVEELSASMAEISKQISENADSAAAAKNLSDTIASEFKHGNERMKQLTEAMNQISKASGQIGTINEAIKNIAFQTNILALNAAVEAAHAGEAGKGFAVVAEEVRNLAGKSAEAAKNAASLVENVAGSVQHGSNVTAETANTLKTMAASSDRSAELIGKIAESSRKQSASVKQMAQGLDQISAVVQTNSATSEESAASSEKLSGQAQSLKVLIQHFKFESEI